MLFEFRFLVLFRSDELLHRHEVPILPLFIHLVKHILKHNETPAAVPRNFLEQSVSFRFILIQILTSLAFRNV